MSLRAFHIVFLISVFSLFIFLCYWNYSDWLTTKKDISIFYMSISAISGLLIFYYGIKFYDKTKNLDG